MPFRTVLLLLVVVWVGVGCRPSAARLDASDRDLPIMREALAKEQAGDMDGAVAGYEEALLQAPRAASAHLALALILHDSRHDYIGAIYHYRRYQAMRPDSQKAALIADRLRVAEQLLAAQSVKKLAAGDSSGQALLLQQLDALNQRLTQSEAERGRAIEERDRLAEQVVQLQGQVGRLQRWVDRLQPPGVDIPEGARAVRRPPAGGGTVRTYEVKSGDSLSRIAEIVYGDPTLWPRIVDANPDKIRDRERVRVGDILVIP